MEGDENEDHEVAIKETIEGANEGEWNNEKNGRTNTLPHRKRPNPRMNASLVHRDSFEEKKMPAQEDQVVADNEDAMVEEDEGVRIDRRALRHALPLLFQRHALTHGRAHIGVVDRPTSPMWTSCKRWASTRPT